MLIKLLLLLFTFIGISLQDCAWNNCNNWSSESDVLNVHLIPHTHDDLGWIKTVDQYYYGSKPELVPVGVQYIYNTVIDELEKHPSRRFSFAETGFLWRWYSSHDDFEKHRLQKLVSRGQIELIGGGWVQNDEASSHYVDIIDQMTLGLKKLQQLFGDCGKPQVAWQIDPFGHSKEQANIFAMMGYTSLFFARIHHLEKEARLQNKSLEFIWNSSDDLKTQILTGAFYQDNYGPPPGFCWDALCGDDPIMDNPDMEDYNVDEKVQAFVKHVRKQNVVVNTFLQECSPSNTRYLKASHQRSAHVMLLMGSDFQYTNANSWYTNLDKLISYVNNDPSLKVKVFYSTPSCYVKGLTEAQPRLPTKNDDFFPYASSNHSYWTGYFTSRPTFKGMIRDASTLLQLAKRLDALADLGPSDDSDVEIMDKASALAQHHDAVTGTAKQNVTNDYEKRLARGMAEAEVVINDFLHVVMPKVKNADVPPQILCQLLNETACPEIRNLNTFSVTVFNPRGQNINETIRIPYYSKQAIVVDGNGTKIESQLIKTFQCSQLPSSDRAPYELWFRAEVGPLGYRTYLVDNSTSVRSTVVTHPKRIIESSSDTDNTISNKRYTIYLDSDGYISNLLDRVSNVNHTFRQEFFLYKGVDNTTDQPSGAYIFRPQTTQPEKFTAAVKTEIVRGCLGEEIRQTILPWITQTIRLFTNSPTIDFEWTVGPIPKETNGLPVTKEIVTRYQSDIGAGDLFYTDANGRQMIQRRHSHSDSYSYEDTEPVAANYYPITNRVFIKDDSNQLTVLTDRAQGATARNGAIEIMLHRRCFYDDHWGVEEALDEPGTDGRGLVARGTHNLILSPVAKAASIHRPQSVRVFNRPTLTFANITNMLTFRGTNRLNYTAMTRPLPSFTNLLSLEKWHRGTYLIRLEHIYQNEEDTINSQPKEVDLKGIFAEFDIVSMEELMLAGNRLAPKSRSDRYKDGLIIQLKPQEIRTYELTVKRKMIRRN